MIFWTLYVHVAVIRPGLKTVTVCNSRADTKDRQVPKGHMTDWAIYT